MKSHLKASRWLGACAGVLALFLPLSSEAYPPAPHHLFYGLLRDELGNPLEAKAAQVILEAASGLQVKGEIIPGLEPGVNYRLAVPMDAGITDDLYKPTALRPLVPFKIKVRIGPIVYLPIEMKGDYAQLGQPGQRTRLDLTLGEDANDNGLPDAWERVLLAKAGTNGPREIRPGDDLDRDGLSNLDEYIAGTYAFDNKDGFVLKILGTSPAATRLEFMAIRGRTYTIYGSDDFKQWTPVQFRAPANGSEAQPLSYYYATDVRMLPAEVVLPAEQPPMRFYKLMVQ